MKLKLAEALLLRKELQEKVDRLRTINVDKLFKVEAKRQNVTDSIDDIVVKVPKITMQQVTHAFDWHAKRLRMVDAIIQQANWTTELAVDDSLGQEFKDPYVE